MTTYTIPSAAVVLYINGNVYGAVSSFHWTSGTPLKAVNGIDSLLVQELFASSAGVQGNVGLYRITSSGGLEGAGIVANFDQLPSEKYFTLQLVDTRTDQILFQAQQCKVESQSWGVSVRELITGTMSFRGIAWENESNQA